MNHSVYVTTSIPYVNASPHIGHALELVQADAIARYHRLLGRQVVLQTGTDENAYKNVLAAQESGLPVRELVEGNAARFRALAVALGVSYDGFVRTAEAPHRRGVEWIWSRLDAADLTRRSYEGLYCAGCEDFLTTSELVDGHCLEHPAPPEVIRESNCFFRLSRYQERLQEAVSSGALRIIPEVRANEVLAFIGSGLRDISISRDSARMGGWGIPVPGEPSQTIYVWIDALMSYVTGQLEDPPEAGAGAWKAGTRKIHVIGKNVWKFHCVYWPALLLSAGLPLPDEVLVHGFLTAEGKKIGKSLGNAVDPFAAAERRGCESLRCYLLSLSPFADSDYAEAAHDVLHESRLSNGLGNLASRVSALCETAAVGAVPPPGPAPSGYHENMDSYRLDRALDLLWGEVAAINREIDARRPWQDPAGSATRQAIRGWAARLRSLSLWLRPFLPATGERLESLFGGASIRKTGALFPRGGRG